MSGQREPNQFCTFRRVARLRHKHALGCALEGKLQIGEFARFAHNYAVRLSEFVRKVKDASQRFQSIPFAPSENVNECMTWNGGCAGGPVLVTSIVTDAIAVV